ncbi:MAG TPA: cysteine desulfurase [Candidatus Korarchaeota archaeon]|nr:cysteine desulfurase [Candidatus Korarchaeota archaeon]
MPIDPSKIREDFPILKRKINGHPLIYLDNAASSQKPKQVIEAIIKFYETYYANIHRGVHTLSQEASEAYEEAHVKVANFISASEPEEIIFVRNTTEAINLVAYSWALRQLKPGDEILITLMEHHSNIVPWEVISGLNDVKINYVGITKEGILDYSDLEKKISGRTKLVSVAHVSNVLGTINDIKRISKLAHEVGAIVLVDGAQSVPHMPVSVKELDCDFLAFSSHKMLGPSGVGVLYAKKEILMVMNPFLSGGGMIKRVQFDVSTRKCKIDWNVLPWKFEAGTPNIEGGIGLGVAVDYLSSIGMEDVRRYEEELVSYTLDRMGELKKIKIYGPLDPKMRGGVISFNLKGISPHDVAMILDQSGIVIRSGYHCAEPLHEIIGEPNGTARASFYIYNTKSEIDIFISKLKEIEAII